MHSEVPERHTKPGVHWAVINYDPLGPWQIYTYKRKRDALACFQGMVGDDNEASLIRFEVVKVHRFHNPTA